MQFIEPRDDAADDGVDGSGGSDGDSVNRYWVYLFIDFYC